MQAFTLHYQSPETFGLEANSAANGTCFPYGFYKIFDNADLRKKMFIVGQQYINQIPTPANMQYDFASGLPLIFDSVITNFASSDLHQALVGARCHKWEFNKINGGLMSNDFAVYRLADIILMKAEAQYRLGNIPEALTTINQKIGGISIRSRVNMPDFTVAEMNPDGLLNERGRELAWEGHRRNDMIRLGHFLDARVPDKTVSEEYRKLYPIPKAELDKILTRHKTRIPELTSLR